MKEKRPLKQRLQAFLRDAAELLDPAYDWCLRLWVYLGPRLMNRALWAAIMVDAAAFGVADANLFAMWQEHPRLLIALVLFNLLIPLTPPDAPRAIPLSWRRPTRAIATATRVAGDFARSEATA